MTVVVQQIVHTIAPARWWALAEALGFVAPYPPEPAWGEFDADGVLAVHHPLADRAPGTVALHLLVDDLDAAAGRLAGFEATRSTMDGVGEVLTVRASSGITLTVSAGARPVPGGEVAVQPIWFQHDIAEARRILEALGLRAGIASDRGGWVELHADGGSVGLHDGEARLGLSFQAHGDLDELAARLRAAGIEASVVDEAFARTLRLPDPDGREEVWINGVQQDLHGYHRED